MENEMKYRYLKYILLLAVLFIPVLATACTPAVQSGTVQQNSTAPSIKILVPRDDPSATGISGYGNCAILVEVSNFNLVDKLGEANVEGEGHIHYFLDTDPSTDPASGTYADTSETAYYWPEIGTGAHVFRVQLVNNDHTPLNPPVIASTAVTAGTWDG